MEQDEIKKEQDDVGCVRLLRESEAGVPWLTLTALLRFAIKNDLAFNDDNYYTCEKILTTLTMIVYPRSLAGLNLNPNREESQFQTNDIETLLKRICKKTYLNESGWEIIRKEENINMVYPVESICEFEKVLLHKNFVFSRPLTVTGAIIIPHQRIDGIDYPEEVFFQQMTLDRIENGEYVLQNSEFTIDAPGLVLIF
ncbi:unnamed protein product [Oikopleura dioica]|uniref:Uncharacterized protein n=1 Tax=Oikopleura dioica TaxID=34765 RepID=E4YE60_OIKDI|nr:unnamed protein product [Oikopleura dioica]